MKNAVTIGLYSLAFSVVLGAFGAHGLKSMVSEYAIEIYNKGVYYQVIHSFGILFGSVLLKKEGSLKLLQRFFLAGIIGFSGSLYVLTFSDVLSPVIKQVVGPVTPIGGVFFILGWIYFAYAFRKETNN